MKLASLLVLMPLAIMSVSATANVAQSNGDTKCTVIDSIAKKKSTTSACSFTTEIGGGNGYGVDTSEYKLKNGKKYVTNNDATYDEGYNGKMINMEYDISLNEKPAKISHLNKKTFKAYDEKTIKRMRDKESAELKDVLICFSALKTKDAAFCTPLPLY